jgi:hypothetical protein
VQPSSDLAASFSLNKQSSLSLSDAIQEKCPGGSSIIS